MSRRRKIVKSVDPVRKIKSQIESEKKIKRKKIRKRKLKRLVKVILIILIGVLIYWFDQSPYSRVRSINVKGNVHISDEVIIEKSKLKENNRLVKALGYKMTQKNKVPGVENVSVKLYYTKGQITLVVKEYPVVGYLDGPKLLFSNNDLVDVKSVNDNYIPKLVGIDAKMIKKFPEFSDKLSRMDESSLNSISEIHRIDEPLEEIYFKLIMNNGYFVFTNLDNLLLMDYYSEIVSGIQKGNKPDNRCIYFLDHGHTPDNQSAVAKPCE